VKRERNALLSKREGPLEGVFSALCKGAILLSRREKKRKRANSPKRGKGGRGTEKEGEASQHRAGKGGEVPRKKKRSETYRPRLKGKKVDDFHARERTSSTTSSKRGKDVTFPPFREKGRTQGEK